MPRAEIGELTDWHVWELYIKPALRRAGKGGERPRKRRARKEKARLPSKEEYARIGALLGGNREEALKAYDRWAASRQGGE